MFHKNQAHQHFEKNSRTNLPSYKPCTAPLYNMTASPNTDDYSTSRQKYLLDKPFFPVQLLIEAKTRTEILNTSRHLIEFFDLGSAFKNNSHSKTSEASLSPEHFQRNKLIQCFNFIRFSSLTNFSTSSDAENSTNFMNEDSEDFLAEHLNHQKIRIPSLSFILLTNTNRQNIFNDSKLNKNTWSYHHQVELNDERGTVIAKQIFFQLNSNTLKFPLCCRSSWVPPLPAYSSPFNTQINHSLNSQKYIIRLNINCKNYELMIFFYRLLFDKCKNNSKKDFSVFVLNQEENIEMQLSLKQHNLAKVNVENLKNTKLVYNIMSRDSFENILRLLDGFVEEIVENKVYTVLDPDRNQIFLVDCSAQQRVAETGLGLGDVYFSTFSINQETKEQQFSHSPSSSSSSSSSTCSGSETNSFDCGSSSGKDSGRWSCSINSNNTNTISASQNQNSSNKSFLQRSMSMNKNTIESYFHNFTPNHSNYYELLTDFNQKFNAKNEQFRQQYVSEQTLNKNFFVGSNQNNLNNPLMSQLKVPAYNEYLKSKSKNEKTKLKHHKSFQQMCQNIQYKNFKKSHLKTCDFEADGDDEREENDDFEGRISMNYEEKKLNSLLKKSSNFSMSALNAIAYRNRLNQKQSIPNMQKSIQHQKFRSHSVLNEPYDNNLKKPNQIKSMLHNRYQNNLPSTSNKINYEIDINRKKSKSVTFMDSIGVDSFSKNIRERSNYKNSLFFERSELPPRSKSTTPFTSNYNQCNYAHPQFSESDDVLIADVDNQEDFCMNNRFKNCLIEPMNKEVPSVLNLKKPNVGITPQTRFRRAHTLDMIRSTRMPLDNREFINTQNKNTIHQFIHKNHNNIEENQKKNASVKFISEF